MGYLDALTSSAFKTTPDGHRLFFPWGVLGRGYVIGSESEYDRLRRQVKIYLIVGIALVYPIIGMAVVRIGAVPLHGYLVALVAIAAWLLFYFAWMSDLLRGLQPSHERLSLRESMTTQAREHSRILLWVLEIGSIGFVSVGVFIFVFAPGKRLTATAGIVFFSLCATVFACMLVMRRGT